ncbi:hypothetical protein TVAG_078510 [Trichomonas vaginalis G3]|uniref:Uncharacterized protein n=1 Tax=Trichomonas vaginalis (strain ATCC PRA-98 / G3) TaxID=412133 RepID=A2FIU7_TRIV3|nr:heat shock protein 26 family [Trichomonas vaginalis G3]EAX95162.1 hypothetical protein TVAG_078510 [Trichomonas vaginalis G3]KAI5514516.1 heat shock protein 26 family [Trichomonas vaginalis G3]|eukprot:XP_001308092.1 hypothetical protein [Trichomonas vaginalis G3]
MNFRDSLKFGIFPEYELDLGTSIANSIYEFQQGTFWCSTNKKLLQIEGPKIKKTFRNKFCCATQLPNSDITVGVSVHHSEIEIWFLAANFLRPLKTGLKTEQKTVMHVLYSPKSHTIITIGSGIKTWNLISTYYERKHSAIYPEVNVTLRKSFLPDYESGILNPPCFDYERELIYIPTPSGVIAYNLDGDQLNTVVKLKASIDNCMTVLNSKKDSNKGKIIFSDPCEGVTTWDFDGRIRFKFPNTPSSIYFLTYIDRENIMYLSGQNTLCILDVKTGRSFQCHSFDKTPNRIFVLGTNPYKQVCCIFSTKIQFLRIVIPWKKYLLNIPTIFVLEKCYRANEASRILIQCGSSFFKLISPKTKMNMTTAVTQSCYPPTGLLYDRGTMVYLKKDGEKNYRYFVWEDLIKQRDEIFVVQTDERVCGFNTGLIPCEQIMCSDFQASKIDFCLNREKICFAIASPFCDLTIRDYDNFRVIYHGSLSSEEIVQMKFMPTLNLICLVYRTTIIIFDSENLAVLCSKSDIKSSNVVGILGNNILIGLEDGTIERYEVIQNDLKESFKIKSHSQRVTNISFSPTFWISTSLDGNVCLYDYDWTVFYKISLPCSLLSGIILNGRREILVATDSELMIIEPVYQMFFNEIDEEHPLLDVFDELDDYLESNAVSYLEEFETQNSSFLSNFTKSKIVYNNRKQSPKKSFDLNELNRLKKLLEKEEKLLKNSNQTEENQEKEDEEQKQEITDEDKEMILREMENLGDKTDQFKSIQNDENIQNNSEEKTVENSEEKISDADGKSDKKKQNNENNSKKKAKKEFDTSQFLKEYNEEQERNKNRKKEKKVKNKTEEKETETKEEKLDLSNIKLFDSSSNSSLEIFQSIKPQPSKQKITTIPPQIQKEEIKISEEKGSKNSEEKGSKISEEKIEKENSEEGKKTKKKQQNKGNLIREPQENTKSKSFKRNFKQNPIRKTSSDNSTKNVEEENKNVNVSSIYMELDNDNDKNNNRKPKQTKTQNSILKLNQNSSNKPEKSSYININTDISDISNQNSKSNRNLRNPRNFRNKNDLNHDLTDKNKETKTVLTSSSSDDKFEFEFEKNDTRNQQNRGEKYVAGDTKKSMKFKRVLVRERKFKKKSQINVESSEETENIFLSAMGGEIRGDIGITHTKCESSLSRNSSKFSVLVEETKKLKKSESTANLSLKLNKTDQKQLSASQSLPSLLLLSQEIQDKFSNSSPLALFLSDDQNEDSNDNSFDTDQNQPFYNLNEQVQTNLNEKQNLEKSGNESIKLEKRDNKSVEIGDDRNNELQTSNDETDSPFKFQPNNEIENSEETKNINEKPFCSEIDSEEELERVKIKFKRKEIRKQNSFLPEFNVKPYVSTNNIYDDMLSNIMIDQNKKQSSNDLLHYVVNGMKPKRSKLSNTSRENKIYNSAQFPKSKRISSIELNGAIFVRPIYNRNRPLTGRK